MTAHETRRAARVRRPLRCEISIWPMSQPEYLTNARMSASTGFGHAGKKVMCEKCHFKT
jgi:hypothetical protein